MPNSKTGAKGNLRIRWVGLRVADRLQRRLGDRLPQAPAGCAHGLAGQLVGACPQARRLPTSPALIAACRFDVAFPRQQLSERERHQLEELLKGKM